MGHRYITVGLILGMVSLPLSCGGDDDDTTSTGAKGGKGGTAGKGGSAGKAGSGAGKGGTSGKGGSTTGGTSGKGGTGGTGGTTAGTGGSVGGTGGSVGGTAGQSGDGSGATSGTGTSGAGAGGQSGAGAGGDGGAGGAVDPATAHRTELVTTICNKPVPNDPDPAGCGMVDACIAYMMMPPFGDSADCVTKYDALLECRAGVAADQFLCGSTGVDPYPVDTDECLTENDAAFYCTT